VAQTALSVGTKDSAIGRDGWLGTSYQPVDLPGVVAVGGWAVIGFVLLGAAFYTFYKAHLPEVANRALFCALLLIPLVLIGVVLGTSGSDGLAEAGWGLQFLGLIGAVYSVIVYRVLDIRRTVRHAAATGILTLVTALALFGALVAARQVEAGGNALILAALAAGVAVAYLPLRRLAQAIANRLVGTSAERSSQPLRRFSEDIAGVVELDALVDVTMRTLGQVLRVRRGGLILVSEQAEGVLRVEPFPRGLGEIPDAKGQIAASSPVGKHLLKSRAPLLQYDLDFGRAYAEATPDERRFFEQMRMSAYAPVRVQDRLVGILCCGAKVSDDPFTDHDLELLMTVANQAGVALRNARLVGDLRRREAEQAALNRALSGAKEQLEKLDGVKSDFITIASHELRTPLAQIRGYTDIMEAMNEQEMLDQDQISGMTASLRKASDRLEELIGAMLDVSQLDVNAMDLRFAPTGIENVVRMAIEPLTEAIQSRKLMLSARGLRSLPPLQADMQRLVQAFRNVVLNAIKYTPDGGRINITGRMEGEMIVVAIQDSGIGIDPANLELIFRKFYRAQDPNLHSTGTTKFIGAGPGLGLTIARGVVEGHGGRIWVESEGHDPERCPGSTFYIALPLTPPSSARRVLPFDMGERRAPWEERVPGDDARDEPAADPSPTIPRPTGWAAN
jgi:signal transduction histidine kinase